MFLNLFSGERWECVVLLMNGEGKVCYGTALSSVSPSSVCMFVFHPASDFLNLKYIN